jgi:hypothetical protein
MKRLLALTTLLVLGSGDPARAASKLEGCALGGRELSGRVEIVQSFADFKVKIVKSFPDLRVQIVSSFPDKCGQWKLVDCFPDFTISFVDSFPDFTIAYVESFPGMP